jgi:transcriptional regulator with XRE-family HTH domain
MSVDEIVSSNLLAARELRGWTQQEAAERLSRYLGKPWSVQVYGDAERAHRINRIKTFNADELTALSRAFQLPLEWWFLPPGPWTAVAPRGAPVDAAMSGDDLLSLLFPVDPQMTADLQQRTERLFSQFAAETPHRDQPAAYLAYVHRQNAVLRTALLAEFKAQEIDNLPDRLRQDAARIERAIGLVSNDLRHEGLPVPLDEERSDDGKPDY